MAILKGVNGTTCDAQQYQQSLSPLTSPDHTITCLTHGQSIGLALSAEASFISFFCVLVIFILIGRNILCHRTALRRGDLKLLRVPGDIYILSIFMFDIIHATGGIFNVRWAHDGQVRMGSYCSAQGIIKQIGALGTALITLILALHTFIAALWGLGTRARGVAFGLVSLTWVFILLWVGIGNAIHHNYETPSPYWCWISPRFKGERLAGEYIWIWIALFASVVMYIPLYLWAEGRLSIGDRWYKFHLSHPDQGAKYTERRACLGMLFYPLAYSLVVLPVSVARWSQYTHKDIPSAAMLFGQSMLNLSGAINVLLFLIIRPKLLLFASPETPAEPEAQMSLLNTAPLLDTVQPDHSPGATRMRTVDGSRNSEAPSHIGSMQGSDGI